MCAVEELTDYVGAEGLLRAAGIKIVIEEAGVLKEQVGHLLDFIIARGALQQAHDDCNSGRANIVLPVTHALVGLLNCVSGLYSVL